MTTAPPTNQPRRENTSGVRPAPPVSSGGPPPLPPPPPDVNVLRGRLSAIGQEHLLNFVPDLDVGRLGSLCAQISALEFEQLPQWVDQHVRKAARFELPAHLEPPVWYTRSDQKPAGASGGRPFDTARYRREGESLIRAGKVAAFCVAGGQGTRLGWDRPKGTYPSTPIRRKSLFQILSEQIVNAQKRYGAVIPFYIMTSPMNHEATVSFFHRHDFFGLHGEDVKFFTQGVMPSFDAATGRILLASKHELALNPNGHGGSLQALYDSGAIDDMKNRRGIEQISYVQIDNPHVHVIDPIFIGLHACAPDSSAQMSSKMLAKTGPFEKLGNFCRAGGRTMIIEYSDLPDQLAMQRDPQTGQLSFAAGSIAIHCLSVRFVEQLNTSPQGFALPLHRAEKKVACICHETGRPIEPVQPNGVKLETFVFDALPLCESSIILETDRIEEFAPIKNLTGVDSAQTSRELQIERAARWLQSAGVKVPRDRDNESRPLATIEISPLFASEAAHLVHAPNLPREIDPGSEIVIE